MQRPVHREPATLIVAHADRKAQRAVARMMGASLYPVRIVSSADELAAALGPDVVAVVDLAMAHAHPSLIEQPHRALIAVPGDGEAPGAPEMLSGLMAAGWRNVIAQPMPILAEELLTTIQKHLRRDWFGYEKYITWGAECREFVLEDARERDEAVAAISRDVVAGGLPDRLGSLVSVVVDELLTNALFTAPVDAAGQRFRRGDSREAARPLRERDRVSLRWATDARYLAIEVRDAWGSMDPALVGPRLAKAGQVSEQNAEGGMGLALAYACTNQLVINVEPGVRTEAIAILDVRYRPTELAKSGSYHAFVGPSPATA